MAFVLKSIENLDKYMEESKPNLFFLEKNMKIFIDIKSFRGKLEQLDINLKKLKITREEFLTKDVNYIVCQKLCSPIEIHSTASKTIPKLPVLSRGHALLQRSNSTSTVNNLMDPVKFAETWKIPVIGPDELYRFIKATLVHKEKKRHIHRNKNLIRYLKKEFIKFEDIEKRLLPVFKCYDQFPEISFLKKYLAYKFKEDKISEKDIKDTKDSEKISIVKDKKQFKKNDKMNYCECCEKLFEEELTTHILTAQHKEFVQISDNYFSLDKIINDLPKASEIAFNYSQQQKMEKSLLVEFKENYNFENNLKLEMSNNCKKGFLNENSINCPKFCVNSPMFSMNFFAPTIVLYELYNPNNSKNIFINETKQDDCTYYDDLLHNNISKIMTLNTNILENHVANNIIKAHEDNTISCINVFNDNTNLGSSIEIFKTPKLNLKNNASSISPPHLEIVSLDNKNSEHEIDKFKDSPPLIFRYDQNDRDISNKNIGYTKYDNTNLLIRDDNLKKNSLSDSPIIVSKILNNVSKLLNESNKEIFFDKDEYSLLGNQSLDKISAKDNEETSIYDYCQLSPNLPCSILNYLDKNDNILNNSKILEKSDTLIKKNILNNKLMKCQFSNVNDLLEKNKNMCNNLIVESSSLNKFVTAEESLCVPKKLLNSKSDVNLLHPSSQLDFGALIDISEDRLKKMNETIQALWTSTYITDLKIKLSKISN